MPIFRLVKAKRRFLSLISGVGLLVASKLAGAAYEYDFPTPVTPIARDILDLHHLIFFICVIIFIGVFGVMFYSVYAHRKSLGHKAAKFHENSKLEVVWTIIPFLILVAMAIPSTAVLLDMDDVSESDMTVKITAYQWKWRYDYLDHDVGFFSVLATPRAQIGNEEAKGPHYLLEVDNPLVLPVDKKVRLLVTTADVLHAWWVPQLGIKKDGIPGFINEMWARIEKPGTYRGQCAELCGKDHGFMPIVVEAVSEDAFNKWVGEQKQLAMAAAAGADKEWAMDELMERGKGAYDKLCAACHQPNGQGIPGVFPAIAGSKIATGPVDGHLQIVLSGKPGTAMQAFAPQLNDVDIAAVITYQRNAFGNKTGDVVQPAQVKAARK
ncbi:MAG: cytochrome c oxidase subunit II [Acidiferrobacterales bacterium]